MSNVGYLKKCNEILAQENPMMKRYRYLIVGGGMTGDSAVAGIHEVDPSSGIGLITEESSAPYKRPPLSKGLWKGEPEESVWLDNAKKSAEIHLSRSVVRIDGKENTVVDSRGDVYAYEKLLLATGGTVRRLPVDAEGIIYFRTFEDYKTLRAVAKIADRFFVIGGGFIGAEMAAALAMNNKHVTMAFPDKGIGRKIYPERLSDFITSDYAKRGISIIAGENVTKVSRLNGTFRIKTSGGKEMLADAVVAGLGIQPNVQLAQAAGLAVNEGITVNEFLQTSHPAIFAAGDVANFSNPALGRRMRVEHEDNAITMGKIAGRNMAGAHEPYNHLPFFYSDLFDLGYEAVGELDSRLETVEDWKEEFREGVVYYLRQGVVRGVLLWNTWGQVENARALISAKTVFPGTSVRGRLPA